jgi:hypothetical protein
MRNVNSDGVEKMMFWQQCSEAQVQVYAEFPGRLAQHRHRYGQSCTMMVFIRITSKEFSTSYRGITPIVHDFVNGCNRGYKF